MILESLLIGPLKLFFEIVYALANRFAPNPGLSIVCLSLVMNLLVLPLYKRADAMQEEARDIEAKLHDGVAHIKKTFSGDERMMILQEYYRQNHYKPTDALNGSVSLLLEVPFFMAAYQFLSGLQSLHGVSFGPIRDLGAPDAMLVLGGITINVLPVLMTLINVISSAIYLKGFPRKTKIQLYGMAGFFLVFLYTSPSGLVFYWTLNNLFSLVKTIFYKLKNPEKTIAVLLSLAGVAAVCAGIKVSNLKIKILLIGTGVLLQLPILWPIFCRRFPWNSRKVERIHNRKVFLMGAVFLTVLVGLLIPSTFIAASPQEFIDVFHFHNPIWYIVRTFCLAAGTFLVWMNVFYWLASTNGKYWFDRIVWILCGCMLVNYMFFGTDMGVITSYLAYENGFDFTIQSKLLNLAVLAVLAAGMFLFSCRWSQRMVAILLTATIAIGGMSILNIVQIDSSIDEQRYKNQFLDASKSFGLSKNGNNIVVIMLDRAMGSYVPYILNEKPELVEKFSGFTYYPNVVSFGAFTNFGAFPLYGGYEYTPVEINKRDTESMVSKHNEALKMMPVLFSEQGYQVTVCDPVYANHQWIPDLSIFEEYPEITAYNTIGVFDSAQGQSSSKENLIKSRHRNFFCFSLMKTMPLVIQPTLYNSGRYNVADYKPDFQEVMIQTTEGTSIAMGMNGIFMDNYYVLDGLSSMTYITDAPENTMLIMSNSMTHDPMLLQAPEYEPSTQVDNTQYDASHSDRFSLDGKTLRIDDAIHMSHYHANMAAFLGLADWFDYLKENDVYDNTRIILVSDHGRGMEQLEEMIVEDHAGNKIDLEWYHPLLLVKDFNSTEFTVSNEFMTNADVPTLATDGIIDNPVNPFTGKQINSDEKYAHEQFISLKVTSNIDYHTGTTYKPTPWVSVKDNIWDKDNWTFYEESVILAEHAAP